MARRPGICLFAKRLERGRFADGEAVPITLPQLGYLLEGIDWRLPQRAWRPQAAGYLRRIESACLELTTSDRVCGLLAGDDSVDALPYDAESLKRLLLAREREMATVSAEAALLRAKAADDEALIGHLKLQIEKLRRDRFGPHSERSARQLDQLELQLEELEASATEDELAAERGVAKTTGVALASGRRASRSPSTCRASA